MNIQKLLKLTQVTPYKSTIPRVPCVNPELLMGVELETENAPRGLGWYADNISDAWSVDTDGSLRPRGEGLEFISKPMPHTQLLSALREHFDLTGFGDANFSDRCSIHVHTNVQDFEPDQLASLCMLYSVVEEVLFHYVNHYGCPNPAGYHRDTNLYCIPWNQCRMNYRLVDKIFSDTGGSAATWQKYTALNLLPVTTIGTIEWRHMHGTADMGKINTWLNIIGKLMEVAVKTPIDTLVDMIQDLNDSSVYRQFFELILPPDLPYTEEYQRPLYEGVINAKYSLVNWDKKKYVPQKPKKIAVVSIGDELLNAEIAEARARLDANLNDLMRGEARAATPVRTFTATTVWGGIHTAAPQAPQAPRPVPGRFNVIQDDMPDPFDDEAIPVNEEDDE
jgi:hypothetical protein